MLATCNKQLAIYYERPNGPRYELCPSVRSSVNPVAYKLLIQKRKNNKNWILRKSFPQQ